MANEKRLIDGKRVTEMLKKAAVHMLNGFPDSYDTGVSKGLIDAADIVNHARTVDAVEVVRCKDCQYGNSNYPVQDGQCVCEYYDFIIRNHDDFCSRGERWCDR